VTLPILRQVAPRAFVNQLWQAALHDGRPSAHACPACGQPLTALACRGDAPEARIKACVRCFWVWFGAETLAAFSEPPSLAAPPLLLVGSLGAREVATALPRPRVLHGRSARR